jgi:hypothetical protein
MSRHSDASRYLCTLVNEQMDHKAKLFLSLFFSPLRRLGRGFLRRKAACR